MGSKCFRRKLEELIRETGRDKDAGIDAYTLSVYLCDITCTTQKMLRLKRHTDNVPVQHAKHIN